MKQIQWFPGHMNKTKRLISEHINRVNIIIEIVDSRIPESSRNPLLAEMAKGKPHLLILNKSDLADREITAEWVRYYRKEKGLNAVTVSSKNKADFAAIIPMCRKLTEGSLKAGTSKVNAMIVGIPNVGKSTFINVLKGQKKASVQNKPGHTRDFQRVVLSNTFTLIDTPGMLWHKFEDPAAGYKLAVMGSIKDSILDMHDIASEAVELLKTRYPRELAERYRLDTTETETFELINEIGRNRGLLLKGGVIDLERCYNIILTEVREGRLGRMSFESPEKAAGAVSGTSEPDEPVIEGPQPPQGSEERS